MNLHRVVVTLAVVGTVVFTGAGKTAAQCGGDCSGDGQVSVDELVRGVNIALGAAEVSTCPIFDPNADGFVSVDEIIVAVNNALNGCGASSPTPTATPTSPASGTPTATAIFVPGCNNGSIQATFSSPVGTNAEVSPADLDLVAAAEVRDPRSGAYLWGITGNVCNPVNGLLRSVQIQLIGPRIPFTPGSYPLTPPLGSLVYVESPAFGLPQPRIWTTTGTTLVIDSVAGGSLTFHVDLAPMTPNTIVAGDPPPSGTFNLSASGTIVQFTSN